MSDFVMSKFASKDDMISAMRAALATCTAERDALRKMAERMCGDHIAPADCYSTGPLTGGWEDSQCPSCQYLAFRAALRGKEGA